MGIGAGFATKVNPMAASAFLGKQVTTDMDNQDINNAHAQELTTAAKQGRVGSLSSSVLGLNTTA